MTWDEADEYCRDEYGYGTSLATIVDDEDTAAVMTLVESPGESMWIGLFEGNETWHWSSGYLCDSDCVDVTEWTETEYYATNQTNCMSLTADEYRNASIYDMLKPADCDTLKPFICDQLPFEGKLTIYSDENFTAEDDGSDPFVIGTDTIYGKVDVDILEDQISDMYQYQVVDVSIESVYVCTADDSADLEFDSDGGSGGCLSPNVDGDGAFQVVGDGVAADYEGTTYEANGSEARFSFLTFGLFLFLCTCSSVKCVFYM